MLFETIRLHNGCYFNLELHQNRMNASRRSLFGCHELLKLDTKFPVPREYLEGTFKCKVYYKEDISGIEFLPYQRSSIHSLKVLFADEIEYSHKFVERCAIEELYERRGISNDILIVKNGYITDTSYANVCFYSKERGWFTPRTPLLAGTMRQKLINEGKVALEDISLEMLSQFEHVSLINAMIQLGDLTLSVSKNISY
jgi:4-amino-4-deoxychorismate lyase